MNENRRGDCAFWAPLTATRGNKALEGHPFKAPLSARDMLPIPGQFRSGSHIEQVQNSGVIVVTDDELSIVLEFRPGGHDGK